MRGLRRAPWIGSVKIIPMADGGEGTLDVVEQASKCRRISRRVCGPFRGREITAPFLFWPDSKEALVEMAVCAGLPLLKRSELDPLRTTTFGVGQLMRAAKEAGAEKISLAVGGSATVDGGAGLAQALGWRLLDASGRQIPPGGGGLSVLDRIEPPRENEFSGVEVEVWCDVTNPLRGAKGAAAVFGPQKGASAADVEKLEAGLIRLADVLERDVGVSIADKPGGGAAGGLAAGAVAFLGARLVSGVEALMQVTQLADCMRTVDWVVTGEGRFDSQSLEGKVVSGLCGLAHKTGASVAVLAGSVAVGEAEWRGVGIRAVEAATPEGLPWVEAIRLAVPLAESAAERLAAKMA